MTLVYSSLMFRLGAAFLTLLPLATASTLCMLWPSQASLVTLVPSQSEHP